MPKLLSRSKHEEFESNSELQVRNQKKREAETRRKEKHKLEEEKKQKAGLRNFRNLRIFAGCEIVSYATVHFLGPFYLFGSFVTFWFASHFTLYVIVIVHVIW